MPLLRLYFKMMAGKSENNNYSITDTYKKILEQIGGEGIEGIGGGVILGKCLSAKWIAIGTATAVGGTASLGIVSNQGIKVYEDKILNTTQCYAQEIPRETETETQGETFLEKIETEEITLLTDMITMSSDLTKVTIKKEAKKSEKKKSEDKTCVEESGDVVDKEKKTQASTQMITEKQTDMETSIQNTCEIATENQTSGESVTQEETVESSSVEQTLEEMKTVEQTIESESLEEENISESETGKEESQNANDIEEEKDKEQETETDTKDEQTEEEEFDPEEFMEFVPEDITLE